MISSVTNPASATSAPDGLMDAHYGQSTESFAQQLATTLEGLVNQSGDSGVQVQVQSPNSDTSQFTVTIQTPAATTPTTTASPSTPTSTFTPTTPTTPPTTVDKSQMTPGQAYWAEQPPAVQALQDMPDDQRYAAAQQLAADGYTIDVPIMVYGWDPLATMIMRQNDGLTWVPSGMQANIPVAPGDSFPGLPSYDPNSPPTGSIPVTTAFAVGTNGQDPWIQDTSAYTTATS